jgi:hypothetical protein
MPQSCTICRHPELAALNGALVENEPLRKIANRFGTTAATVYRHRQHLPSQLTQARQAHEMANATTMLERIGSLIERLSRIAQKAEEDRAWSSAAAAIREIRACLTLLAQLTGGIAGTNIKQHQYQPCLATHSGVIAGGNARGTRSVFERAA